MSLIVDDVLRRVLRLFPQNFSFAFAYGSAIFKQGGGDLSKKRMIDFILAVNDPTAWHAENLKSNPRHYSLLRLGGANLISKVQQNLGANIYFNTLVPFEDKLIKYGVISTSKLITDLLDWETMYVSGRLHKPVLILKEPCHPQLKSALKVNLHSALHAALLQLPEVFSEQDLYMYLAGLSYKGDFRMILGENRNKVFNIVMPQVEEFRNLYRPHIKSMSQVLYWDETKHMLEQDCSSSARLHHLNLIPKQLQHRLVIKWHRDGRYLDVEEILTATAQDSECAEMISLGFKKLRYIAIKRHYNVKLKNDFILKFRKIDVYKRENGGLIAKITFNLFKIFNFIILNEIGIEQIVNKSSWSQGLKGILTAGLLKSLRYGGSKFAKMLSSLNR